MQVDGYSLDAQKDKLREFDAALSDKNYQKRKSFTERLRDCFSDK